MKLQNWLEIWLEKYKKHTIKYRTYLIYKKSIQLHINPLLGNEEIKKLNVSKLQNYFNHLCCNGNLLTGHALSTNSILAIKTIFKQSLSLAINLKYLKENPFPFLSFPPRKEKEIMVFDAIEQKRLENYCLKSKKPNHFGVVLCLYTGIRIGELLALTWDDVDFDKNLLNIRHTLNPFVDDERDILQSPKTNSSKRIIPLSSTLIDYLKKLKKKSKSKFIISTRTNGYVSIRNYQRTFEAILKKCNIKPRNFHSLRHTFATRALETGMDVKTLSEILGHKNASITLNRYSHSMFDYKKMAMNKLSKQLSL